MYDELIKNLRVAGDFVSLSGYQRDLMRKAADAIEELTAERANTKVTQISFRNFQIATVAERKQKETANLCQHTETGYELTALFGYRSRRRRKPSERLFQLFMPRA